MAYSLQTTERKNYKENTNVQVLQDKRGLQKPAKDQLYPKEIRSRAGESALLRLQECNEWKSLEKTVPLPKAIEGRLFNK